MGAWWWRTASRSSLRLHSAQGKLISRIGRKGQGPGEFRGKLDLLGAGGDSVLVYDADNLRLTLFSPEGKLMHEWTAADTKGSPARPVRVVPPHACVKG